LIIVYTSGVHPILSNVEDGIVVDLKGRDINPPDIEQLARDKVPVFLDVYAVAEVANSYVYLTAVKAPEALLTRLLESETRMFASQWRRATDLIRQKDLLDEFLRLPCNDDPEHPTYAAFRSRLEQMLRGTDDDICFLEEGINNIMEHAGKFCGSAAGWGFNVTQVHVKEVDLPKRIKDEAAIRAAEPDFMAEKVMIAETKVAIAAKLRVAFPSCNDTEINTMADVAMGINIKKSINEVTLRDPDNIAGNFASAHASLGPELGEALIQAIKTAIKDQGD
jgi:regulator of protease activity HflC (stomatin/prohibitin superfamily)